MATTRPTVHTYNTSLSWKEERKGVAFLEGAPALDVSSPAYKEFWNPEALLLASVETCFMIFFVGFARRAGLDFVAYGSEAEGVAERDEDRRMKFTKVSITPKVVVTSREDTDKAKQVIAEVEESCLITRSLACEVVVEPQIEVSNG